MSTIADLRRQNEYLHKKNSFAWKRVYVLENELIDARRTELGRAETMIRDIVMPYRENGVLIKPREFPPHITNMLWEWGEKINAEFTCCVCWDLMNKDTFSLTPCGHELCINCMEKIAMSSSNKCPTCRKKMG